MENHSLRPAEDVLAGLIRFSDLSSNRTCRYGFAIPELNLLSTLRAWSKKKLKKNMISEIIFIYYGLYGYTDAEMS
jgi:hypothetical protein